ncbi:MAG: lipoprotein [Burkholderiaceae bacterium]
MAIASATALGLAGCGQQGPLRHPWETAAEARNNADSRRLPQATSRNVPTPSNDPSATPARP